MAVIYYNKRKVQVGFEQQICLLYVGKANREQTSMPSALHSHSKNLELQYVYRGKGVFRIDNDLYHVQAGDLIVYNSGIVHDECADPEAGMWFYNCGIKGVRIKGLPENHLIGPEISPLVHCGSMRKRILQLFDSLHDQISRERDGGETISHYLAGVLLLLLLHQIPWEAKDRANKQDRVFIQLKDYLDKNYCEDIKIESLSTMFHLSPSGLTHQFKKHTGFSPLQYIIRRRIGLAQSLLISTDKSITEISMLTGYDNMSHFNNAFKKMVGLSPQSFRKYRVGDHQYKKLDSLCDRWENL